MPEVLKNATKESTELSLKDMTAINRAATLAQKMTGYQTDTTKRTAELAKIVGELKLSDVDKYVQEKANAPEQKPETASAKPTYLDKYKTRPDYPKIERIAKIVETANYAELFKFLLENAKPGEMAKMLESSMDGILFYGTTSANSPAFQLQFSSINGIPGVDYSVIQTVIHEAEGQAKKQGRGDRFGTVKDAGKQMLEFVSNPDQLSKLVQIIREMPPKKRASYKSYFQAAEKFYLSNQSFIEKEVGSYLTVEKRQLAVADYVDKFARERSKGNEDQYREIYDKALKKALGKDPYITVGKDRTDGRWHTAMQGLPGYPEFDQAVAGKSALAGHPTMLHLKTMHRWFENPAKRAVISSIVRLI